MQNPYCLLPGTRQNRNIAWVSLHIFDHLVCYQILTKRSCLAIPERVALLGAIFFKATLLCGNCSSLLSPPPKRVAFKKVRVGIGSWLGWFIISHVLYSHYHLHQSRPQVVQNAGHFPIWSHAQPGLLVCLCACSSYKLKQSSVLPRVAEDMVNKRWKEHLFCCSAESKKSNRNLLCLLICGIMRYAKKQHPIVQLQAHTVASLLPHTSWTLRWQNGSERRMCVTTIKCLVVLLKSD